MPGERTVVRIYKDAEDAFNVEWICEGLTNQELLKLAGSLNLTIARINSWLLETSEDMSSDQADNVRRLLDGDD